MPYFEDKIGDYESFKDYCDKNGLKVNHVISQLISDYLKGKKR